MVGLYLSIVERLRKSVEVLPVPLIDVKLNFFDSKPTFELSNDP